MSYVYELLLAAAVLHAIWNAVLKAQPSDYPLAKVVLFNLVPAVIALPLIPYFGLPSRSAYVYLVPAALLQVCYTIGLVQAFRAADLAQVYPIVRGAMVFFTTVSATILFGERLDVVGWLAVSMVALGVFLVTARGGREALLFERKAVYLALSAALANSGFFVLDGFGARASGNANAYAVTLFVLVGIISVVAGLAVRGPAVVREMTVGWNAGLFSGTISLFTYWIAIWAMTVAPIPFVSALRATSVFFGAIAAFVFLREPMRVPRVIAVVMIVVGVALIVQKL